MPEPTPRRFGRLPARKPNVPSERDWDHAVLLVPLPASRDPGLISDGSGLPFAPDALNQTTGQLDAQDPAVAALVSTITRQAKPERSWVPGRRGNGPPKAVAHTPSLAGWRIAARTDEEVLFTRGRPPQLVTVAVRRDSKRRTWTCLAVSTGRPLRATREGVRASGWRLDPTREPDPGDRELRVLITEQTWAGGMRADDRLLAPDLHMGPEELVLRAFVSPRQGFQVRAPNPETPARIALPGPVGPRRIIDGALYGTAAQSTNPPTSTPGPDPL